MSNTGCTLFLEVTLFYPHLLEPPVSHDALPLETSLIMRFNMELQSAAYGLSLTAS